MNEYLCLCLVRMENGYCATSNGWVEREEESSDVIVPWHHESVLHGNPGSWTWSIPSFEEEEEEDTISSPRSASKSHSQAEKRRRDRINSQLSTLRKLIPKSDKMDKAALLASVVEKVKDLKRKASELSQVFTVPSDVDEVIVDCNLLDKEEENKPSVVMIRASVCCEDRPELFAEMTQAMKGFKLRPVRAEVSCLGGRIRTILVLCWSSNDTTTTTTTSINNLRQSLKVALTRIVGSSSSSASGSGNRVRSKRHRFFSPPN